MGSPVIYLSQDHQLRAFPMRLAASPVICNSSRRLLSKDQSKPKWHGPFSIIHPVSARSAGEPSKASTSSTAISKFSLPPLAGGSLRSKYLSRPSDGHEMP